MRHRASGSQSPAKEEYGRYFEQPVEVDAREKSSEYVEGMTPEELGRLLGESDQLRPAASITTAGTMGYGGETH